MGRFTGIKTEMEGVSKKLVLNWNPIRRGVLIFTGIVCFVLLIGIFNGSTTVVSMNKVVDTNSVEGKIIGSVELSLFYLLWVMLFYPLRTIIKKEGNGKMSIEKRDIFFFSKEYTVSNAKDALFVLRKRKRKWFLLKSNYYWPFIKYSENGQFEEVDLVPFVLHHTNSGTYETIKKEEAEEICKYLDLKLVVEE